MPRRNLVWLLVVAAIGVSLWVWPHTIVRRDALYQRFAPLLDVQAEIHRKYVEEVEDKVLLRGAIRGMLRELDPFSDYFDPEEYPQFLRRTTGQFYGIGVEVSLVGGYLTIVSPIEDSPAFKAGLRAGDRIVQIDGRPTRDLTLEQAVARMGGDPGTSVRLQVWSPGDDQPRDVTIVRQLVKLHSVKGYATGDGTAPRDFVDAAAGIGYVRLTNFDENTAQQLDAAVGRMYAAGLRALILDVRDNPGGLLKTAVEVADRFLSEGRIVSTKGRASPEEVWSATTANDYPKQVPLAVLINDGSASASEIVAGALRDHGRAVVVGETSFGKGSVQRLLEMARGESALKLTTAYYYLPKGERIHGRGVQPDVEVRLSRREKEALLTSMPSTAPARDTATGTAPRPPVVDRQLEKALDLLRARLGVSGTQPLNGGGGLQSRPEPEAERR